MLSSFRPFQTACLERNSTGIARSEARNSVVFAELLASGFSQAGIKNADAFVPNCSLHVKYRLPPWNIYLDALMQSGGFPQHHIRGDEL